MMKKMYKLVNQHRRGSVILLLLLMLLLFLIIGSALKNNSLIVVFNENYKMVYDHTWDMRKQSESEVLLQHGSKSTLKIEIKTLKGEDQYQSIDDTLDNILYQITKQNKELKLISKKNTSVAKDQYPGYKLLYEKDQSQIMVVFYKKSDHLIVMSYKAENDFFDILLDSVEHIFYNFEVREETFDLASDMNIKTTQLTYQKEESITKKMSKNRDYEIAHKNYKVTYAIPSNFQLDSLDTSSNRFQFKDINNGSITMRVDIQNRNLYEYLNPDHRLSLYQNYEIYRTGNSYEKFEEGMMQKENETGIYIYKNRYYDQKSSNTVETTRLNETLEYVYALNKNHIIVFKLSSRGVGIPKKLIDAIEVKQTRNYASNITRNEEDGKITSTLKTYVDDKKEKILSVGITLPSKYQEYEEDGNQYETRFYGLDYDSEKNRYDITVSYNLSIMKVEDKIKSIHRSFLTSYGPKNDLLPAGEIVLDGKTFAIYQGGYTNLGGVFFTNIDRVPYYVYKTVLFHKIDQKRNLVIELNGNGKEISREIMNEVIHITVEKK